MRYLNTTRETDGNKEVIFAIGSGDNYGIYSQIPHGVTTYNGSPVGGWGGIAVFLNSVERFYTKNGKLPQYDHTFPDKSDWFESAGLSNPDIIKLNVNREPRFYVNICFNGAYWIGDQKTRIQLYYTGGSGKKGTWDFPRSGYIAIKNVSPSSNPKNGNYIKRPFVIMRYAEILLNYVEALNEYDPGNADIETYLNKIRERGGLGPVQSDLNQSQMREQIRLERRIELCFEQLRYFDTRRWLIADQTDGGPFYGMNVDAGNSFTDEAFYEKTVFETRVFRPEFYLFPIPQSEINRDPQIVQNPGW